MSQVMFDLVPLVLMMVVRVALVRVPVVRVSVLVRVAEPKPWRGTIVINIQDIKVLLVVLGKPEIT